MAALTSALRRALPRGGAMPVDLWASRHRMILAVLGLHVLVVPVWGLAAGKTLRHVFVETAPIAFFAASASLRTASGPRTRSVLAALGLLTASAMVVHIAGGQTEAHFHFFVVVGLIALYQDWRPFLAAIAYVGLHHAVLGVVKPGYVFGHDAAQQRPLAWALIHAAFVLAASAAQVTTWRLTEAQHERSEAALRASERWFRTLIERSTDGVTVLDDEGRIVYDSPAVDRWFGLGTRLGESGLSAVHHEEVGKVVAACERLGPGDTVTLEVRMVAPDGIRWVEARITDLRDIQEVAGMVVNYRDITERRELEQELAHQAFHDALTGLPNRTLFADRIERAIEVQGRGDRALAAVLFIDLDDFKLVNDGMGHVVGDEVLVEAGRRIVEILQPGDTCARLGGDEFGVLLEEAGPDGEEVAQRLVDALQIEMLTSAGPVRLTASVGLAFAGAGDLVDDVVRNADLAMYRAKARGKARLEHFEDGMRQATLERLALAADLRRALDAGEFVPHYQPVVSLHTGEPVGVEALVRWEHPERGRLAPAAFIELAESSGAIVEIGLAMLRQACTDAARWALPLSLSVNLSARQLQDDGLVDDVAAALADAGLPASRLTLEITESVLVADPDMAAATLAQLKSLGVTVVLDDFGTGYSSLSYLNRFPVDGLKIDKSFVDALESTSGNDAALLEAIVALGRTLELSVVAEGVEDDEQLGVLRALGCGLAQGYLFARPMPNDELAAWTSAGVPV